jgi:uncharacterized protein YndB with AHSA1/START domain
MSTTTGTTAADTKVAVRVFRIHIKASQQAVWDAVTDPEWNGRYGYKCPSNYELRPGGEYRVFANDAMKAMGAPDLIIDGEVVEADPPRRLVQTWRALFSPETAAEGFTRLIWDLDEANGVTRLTVTHEVEGAPNVEHQISGDDPNAGGGWSFILSDLKTLLETGSSFES